MEQPDEKLNLLKREEIRTMAKDMARLREKDAKKERERILLLQNEKKQKVQEQKDELPKDKGIEQEKVVLIPPLHSPSSKIEKVVVRVVVVGIVLFFLGNMVALSYYMFWKNKGQPLPLPSQQQEDQELIEPEQPTQPPSLIKEQGSLSSTYTEITEIPVFISQSLQRILPQSFTRILLKSEQEYATTTTIFEAFSIIPPEELLSVFGDNITPFIFSSNGKNHLGLALEINDQELSLSLVKSWEETMERDTRNLFAIMGEKGQGYTFFFQTTSYKQIPIRFQTFSSKDFGIVYAVFQGRLVITGSLESMQRVIDTLSTQTQ